MFDTRYQRFLLKKISSYPSLVLKGRFHDPSIQRTRALDGLGSSLFALTASLLREVKGASAG
jgi:hypothetical protein